MAGFEGDIKPRIAVVTSAFQSRVGEKTLANLLAVMEPLAQEIFVVTGKVSGEYGEKVHVTSVINHSPQDPLILKAFKHRVLTQFKISFHLWRISPRVDQVLFFTGMPQYWMSMLVVKLRRKRVILLLGGSAERNARGAYQKRGWGSVPGILPYCFFRLVEIFNYFLADQIVVESGNVISWAWKGGREKSVLAGWFR